MYGGIPDPGMRYYPPRVVLALRSAGWGLASSQWGWGFHTIRGGVDPWDHRFYPRIVVVYMYGSICDPGVVPYPRRGWHWVYELQVGVSTPCGAVSTRGTTIFVPGFLEDVWKDSSSGNGILAFPGGVGSMNTRLGFRKQPVWGWGFHTVRGVIDPGGRRFRPRFVGVVDVWKHG